MTEQGRPMTATHVDVVAAGHTGEPATRRTGDIHRMAQGHVVARRGAHPTGKELFGPLPKFTTVILFHRFMFHAQWASCRLVNSSKG